MNLRVDLHTHTVASGHAYSTIYENAQAAAEAGLEAIAITDHGPALPGGAHDYHFWNLRILPDEMAGVKILHGVEANITDNQGTLDLGNDILSSLDIVLASFHPACGFTAGTAKENTDVLIKVMSNPNVHILAHPGNPWFPVDAERVVEAAGKYNVLLEINNSSFLKSRPGGEELSREIAKTAAEAGLDVVIGSDAHLASLVGGFSEAIAEAEAAGFDENRIVNARLAKVTSFLEEKKSR